MRGQDEQQSKMFAYFSPEQRVPKNHPLRRMHALCEEALKGLSSIFSQMYSHTGRPSIPPERLLKASLLIALYSVRSDRLFCEMLDYNILFRWFLGMNLEEESFDASSFSKNRERLLKHDVAQKFFDAVVVIARKEGLLSDEHFTVDGTLIEGWASMKSFVRKDDDEPKPPSIGRNVEVDFHGQKRSNETHQSTTDPEVRLARKSKGTPSILGYSGHALMDNRHGLCVDVAVLEASGKAERQAAIQMLSRQAKKRIRPSTLGADKAYHCAEFVSDLRARKITPHLALQGTRKTPGLDGRTWRSPSYAVSQRKRKLVEEVFGWMKTVGGLYKVRLRGRARVDQLMKMLGAAYNLLRLTRLSPQPT